MKRVLLSAFACDPTKGSESSIGWNWAIGLAEKGIEVHCLTREISRAGISTETLPRNLTVHYVRLPFEMEKLYSATQYSIYLYYLLWQWKAYRIAAGLHKDNPFDLVHHVSWGSLQMGSFMYKLDIPLVFGPAGGGQTAPAAFKKYFGAAWATEENRDRVSGLLLRFNPACRSMLKKAAVVLASNEDTARMAEANGASNIRLVLDAGLPRWFFPETNVNKVPQTDTLKLLWVGRFMPRKGMPLVLDVMKALKEYPGITLNVVGDGVARDVFLETVKKYQLEDTVHWDGQVPWAEVRGCYADHDVFFFTSLRDSCPMQIVEAMAFGMPVVTLDLHGQGVIVDVDRGFKCSCSTPDVAIESLKSAILDLYNSPALFERLRAGAFKFAANQAWDKKIDSVIDQLYL
jgi:glycosyltransferase involved in cell wall biosynthesis